VNILKHDMLLDQLATIVRGLFILDNTKIVSVTREAYFAATELEDDLKLEANDALALDTMRLYDIKEIYSFYEDFDQIEGITRLPKNLREGSMITRLPFMLFGFRVRFKN